MIGGQTRNFYYHTDALGTIAALTEWDTGQQTEKIVERYTYDAYGRVTVQTPGADGTFDTTDDVWSPVSTVGNPYTFTARSLDNETGLMYYRARYYSTLFGGFISRDPLGYVDGMNLYAGYFVPNGTDPSGTYANYNYMPTTSVTRYVTYMDFNTYRVLTIDTWAQNHDEIVPLKRSKAWEAVKAQRAGATAAQSSGGGYPELWWYLANVWWPKHPGDQNRHWAFYLGEYVTCHKGGDCIVRDDLMRGGRVTVNGPTRLSEGKAKGGGGTDIFADERHEVMEKFRENLKRGAGIRSKEAYDDCMKNCMSSAEGGQNGVIGWALKHPGAAIGIGAAAGAPTYGVGTCHYKFAEFVFRMIGQGEKADMLVGAVEVGGMAKFKSWISFGYELSGSKNLKRIRKLQKQAWKAGTLRQAVGGAVAIDLWTRAGYMWARNICESTCGAAYDYEP